jgi:hypothetical protein
MASFETVVRRGVSDKVYMADTGFFNHDIHRNSAILVHLMPK